VRCSSGHDNAPNSVFCTTCGVALVAPAPTQGLVAPQQVVAPPGYGMGSPYGAMPPGGVSRRPGWVIPVVIGAIAAAIVLVIIVVNATTSKPVSLLVRMTVYGVSNCEMGLGYFDVPGSEVTVRADGVEVGSGTLSVFGSDEGYACMFSTSIPNVPSDAENFAVKIGRRGTVTATRGELVAADWVWNTSLGE